jgi:hypothetical protein
MATAALFAAAILVSPAASRAEDKGATAIPMTQASPPQAEAQAPEAPVETLEQRVSRLHEELKITHEEEGKWASVANAMKENASAMERLIAERDSHGLGKMTAVQDLKLYEKFTQTHAIALRNLIDSFELLYNSMPAPQKAIADDVFEKFAQKGAPPYSH